MHKVRKSTRNVKNIKNTVALEQCNIKREPGNWEAVLRGISAFRAENEAPVDTIGCSKLSNSTCPKNIRYQILTSLQLSSQTKDQVTADAMQKLQSKAGELSVQAIIEMSNEDLSSCINKVGFHRRKLEYIKKTAEILSKEYENDIPSDLEGLLKLPGIGPKMAYLTMQCAWNKTVGIGVDTHVHRISNRLGWVKTKEPEQTRKELEEWLPQCHWGTINELLVGFGQIHCTPQRPKCSECPVKTLCPKIGTKSK